MRLLLFVSVIGILVGCGGDAQPLPNLEATVEARVAEELASKPAASPTATALPVTVSIPTPTALPAIAPEPTSTVAAAVGSESTPTLDPPPTLEPSGIVSQKETGEGQSENNGASGNDKTDDDEECLSDADSKTGHCVDGKSVVPGASSGLDQEKCENASGAMAQQCMDEAVKMIEENPALCDTATGLLASLCQIRAGGSASSTQGGPAQNSGSGTGSGGSENIANPCDKVAEAFRSQCEESIRSDPDSGFYRGDRIVVENFDPDNIPKIAKVNFTELDKFSRMSKLRSVVGHDYAFGTTEYDPEGLNCRSMKHYFIPVGVPRQNSLYGSTPHTFEWMSIKFFAPSDGVIKNVVRMNNEYGEEAQFAVTSNDHPGYLFNYYHVKLLPGLDTGSVVSAGQQIGTLGHDESWGEIAVQVQIGGGKNILLSFLQVATDEVLEEYKARGLNTASDAIITKEQRDANPIGCEVDSEARWFEGGGRGGTVMVESFVIWAFESTDNWFFFD